MTRPEQLAAYYRRLAASGKYPPATVAALLARANEHDTTSKPKTEEVAA